MPLKLSVGLSRKQGLPHFGSAGATCHVEVELPADVLKETQGFLMEAERALDACRQVVETELARQSRPTSASAGATTSVVLAPASGPLEGAESAPPPTLQLPSPVSASPPVYRERPSDRPATPRQLQAIERLTLRLGAHPQDWLHERIGDTPPHCLSLAEASALIDELQQQLPPRMAG